ncbi:MAG: FRG domain-containing protein [Acetobacteraceae bacterium]|nr:FRG domain-containing protein [Acetobacteraceae bacterium]
MIYIIPTLQEWGRVVARRVTSPADAAALFKRAVSRAKAAIGRPLIPATWPKFLAAVRKARSNLGNPDAVWYRGHSQVDYQLVPSLLRHKQGVDKENVLFGEYERSARRFLERRTDDWELLVDMQHYGIPTRLLDWTGVLGIALAFALYQPS